MVKCSECGFLSYKSYEDGILHEADEEFRKGEIRTYHNVTLDIAPICFVRAFDLVGERKQLEKEQGKYRIEDLVAVMAKERACTIFTQWHQGSSPKEHREMLDRQWQLDYERSQRKADRRWRIIETVVLVIGAGLFTLLGAWIARIGQSP